MKKILSICIAAALVLSLATAAFAAGDAWGEYSMENNGYGYLTANFPSTYPADMVIPEGAQVVSDKIDAILFNGEAEVEIEPLTDAEKQEMVTAFAASPVEWAGVSRMGIPAVSEGETIEAADVFTSFDADAIAEALAQLALLARADGHTALRLVGLEAFPEALAAAAEELFSDVMSENGVIALIGGADAAASDEGSGEPSAETGDTDAQVREILTAIGIAGYLQYVQISREGAAARDTTPPPSITVEAIAYEKPLEPGETAILLPDSATAGETFEVVVMGPADAVSAMLRDEAGENLPIEDMLKENLGDSMRFTFYVHFDAPVSMPVYLYFMSASGWNAEPEASADLVVG